VTHREPSLGSRCRRDLYISTLLSQPPMRACIGASFKSLRSWLANKRGEWLLLGGRDMSLKTSSSTAHASDERLETRIRTQWIELWLDVEIAKRDGPLSKGLLEPRERLVQ
jgi:hypothetical protein